MNTYGTEADNSLTVLDRLLLKTESVREIRGREFDSLTRDLQLLLNTRRQQNLIDPEFEECVTSVLNFGLPDLTQCGSLETSAEQKRVCGWLEEAIEMFEPRLCNVTVKLIPAENQKIFLRFRLEASAELSSGRVAYDMGLKRDTGEFSVSQRGGA
jgi:type VI secretion system lysozyme-like protein